MSTFRISTPGPGFTRGFPDVTAALDWCDRYLPCSEGHRRERAERDGVHYTRVVDTEGRTVTGAAVRQVST